MRIIANARRSTNIERVDWRCVRMNPDECGRIVTLCEGAWTLVQVDIVPSLSAMIWPSSTPFSLPYRLTDHPHQGLVYKYPGKVFSEIPNRGRETATTRPIRRANMARLRLWRVGFFQPFLIEGALSQTGASQAPAGCCSW